MFNNWLLLFQFVVCVSLHFVVFNFVIVFCDEEQINECCKRTLPHCCLHYWSLFDVGLWNKLVMLVKTAFYIDPAEQAASQKRSWFKTSIGYCMWLVYRQKMWQEPNISSRIWKWYLVNNSDSKLNLFVYKKVLNRAPLNLKFKGCIVSQTEP